MENNFLDNSPVMSATLIHSSAVICRGAGIDSRGAQSGYLWSKFELRPVIRGSRSGGK